MRIAIVKLSSLGDIVHSMVALQFIKRTYPDAKIDWIVEDKFKGILENNPHLNNIYTIDLKKAKKQKSIFLLFLFDTIFYKTIINCMLFITKRI